MNIISIIRTKRESLWLLSQDSKGIRLCVNVIPLDFVSEESLYHDHSSGTSSWESDVSIGDIFIDLSVNMVSTSHLENENEEMIQSDIDPWIKH